MKSYQVSLSFTLPDLSSQLPLELLYTRPLHPYGYTHIYNYLTPQYLTKVGKLCVIWVPSARHQPLSPYLGLTDWKSFFSCLSSKLVTLSDGYARYTPTLTYLWNLFTRPWPSCGICNPGRDTQSRTTTAHSIYWSTARLCLHRIFAFNMML